MKTQIKTDHELSTSDREHLEKEIVRLDRLTEHYESRHLHVTVARVPRSTDVSVKLLLALGHRRLVCEERAPGVGPAAHQCLAVLSRKVALAKERVHRRHGERGVRRAKAEAALVDPSSLRTASASSDYAAFREALHEAPEAVEAELARRLKRHPDAEALLGDEFVIADLVEGVLHRAFESFATRPASGPIHDWLFHWIDPTIDEFVAAWRP